MEKERFFAGNWPSTDAMLPPGMNPGAGSEEMLHSFLNIGWEQPMHHDAHVHFESALSSLVSSPSSNAPAGNDSVVIRELIGRLGSICNSGDISPSSRYHSAHTSCYSTPLNSPPKLNLSGTENQQQGRGGLLVPGSQAAATQFASFAADPAFAQRAAKFSCFGPRTSGGLGAQLGLPESGNLSRVSSSQSLMAVNGKEVAIAGPERMEMERSKYGGRTPGSSSPEASSAPERLTAGGGDNNGRKRKAAPKGKAKGAPLSSSTVNPLKEDNYDIKRCKPAETNSADKNEVAMPKTEPNSDRGSQKQGEENNVKPSEPLKDYIHVRARRGQATDSHSLAERVRREKISERMKMLQDLVPGCNKITGKAVMLDEIINYVQSLQRQVEFLSMKLATLNPQLEFDMENLLPKDMNQTQTPLSQHVYPLDMASSAFSYAQHPQGAPLQSAVTNGLEVTGLLNPLDSFLRKTSSLQLPPLDGFTDAASQLGTMWEDDLQYFVQMGSGQSQGAAFTTSSTLRPE